MTFTSSTPKKDELRSHLPAFVPAPGSSGAAEQTLLFPCLRDGWCRGGVVTWVLPAAERRAPAAV